MHYRINTIYERRQSTALNIHPSSSEFSMRLGYTLESNNIAYFKKRNKICHVMYIYIAVM